MSSPGKRRHRVQLQSRAAGVDAAGNPNGAWSTYASAWAQIEPISGKTAYVAQQLNSAATHVLTIGYRTDVTISPRHQVLWEGRALMVEAVQPVDGPAGIHVEWRLFCVEAA